MELVGQYFTVCSGNGIVSEIDGGGESGVAKEPEQMGEEGFGAPPADDIACGGRSLGGFVMEGGVMHGQAIVDGGLNEGGFEWFDGQSAENPAFGKDHESVALR